MGYFSELSIQLQEQRELLFAGDGWEDHSCQSPVQALLLRLEDFKEYLRHLVDVRREWELVYLGAPRSDFETQYRAWEAYWPPKNQQAFYYDAMALAPGEELSIDDVMEAIAGTKFRLLCYGYDADAEEARLARLAKNKPLDGQLELPMAA